MVSYKDPRLKLAGEYTITVEHKNFVKLKEIQLFNLVIKLIKPLALPTAYTKWKTKRGTGIKFLALIITLMLSTTFNEAPMSISNKYNNKTFTKSHSSSKH